MTQEQDGLSRPSVCSKGGGGTGPSLHVCPGGSFTPFSILLPSSTPLPCQSPCWETPLSSYLPKDSTPDTVGGGQLSIFFKPLDLCPRLSSS